MHDLAQLGVAKDLDFSGFVYDRTEIEELTGRGVLRRDLQPVPVAEAAGVEIVLTRD